MDRFIAMCLSGIPQAWSSLKSNMDRFIELVGGTGAYAVVL